MSDRTFKVIVISPNPRWKPVSYPGANDFSYNGIDALEVMRSLTRLKSNLKVIAYTKANEIEENLTIQEMENLFGEETNARPIWERRIKTT
jgi:hypothetical protein